MHETGIVRDLIRRLEAAARDAGAIRVLAIDIRLGALCAFSAAHFQEHFIEEARGTCAEGATLRIQISGETGPHAQDVMMEHIELEVPDD